MKYAIQTFGCKVNQYESAVIETAMRDAGFIPCEMPEEADIVIINSCTVTESGDKKALKAVRAAKKHARAVVLCGCFVQAYPEKASQSGADIISGTAGRTKLPELIREYLSEKAVPAGIGELPREYEETPFSDFGEKNDKTRAFIKIEDGCDRYCSYCAIPYARGRVRSRGLENIYEEARLCAQRGYKELVLVGINLSRYGSDIGTDLAAAVHTAAKPDGIARVRLSSLEPELLDGEMIKRVAGCKKLCPHFHLSLQSGCAETLKRMNRRYTPEEYFSIVRSLRESFPDCAVTTDVMVGFSGETDEEFEQSLSFVEEVGFARVHVFTYSVREGTAAASYPDKVSAQAKEQRYDRMSALAAGLYRKRLEAAVSRTYEILVQKRTSPDYAQGLTPDYLPVRVYGSSAKRQDIIRAAITGVGEGFLIGEELTQ